MTRKTQTTLAHVSKLLRQYNQTAATAPKVEVEYLQYQALNLVGQLGELVHQLQKALDAKEH